MNSKQSSFAPTLPGIFICAMIMLTSCASLFDVKEIKQISYGTSFGECIGYCKHNLNIKKGSITYNCSGWIDTLQTITRTETIPDSVWNLVSTGLKINEFMDLPEVIGCPDCADGGAEWLEIELNGGTKHKVTFEYNHEPQALKFYIPFLRQLMEKNNCEK